MENSKKNNPNIKLGNVGLNELGFGSAEDFLNPKNGKIKITLMLDLDLYDSLKKEANARSGKYQTLMNTIIRDYFDSTDEATSNDHINAEIKEYIDTQIKKKLAKIRDTAAKKKVKVRKAS